MTLFPQSLLVALIALLVDGLAGYPKRLFAVIGHPVTWVGALIARLDENLNRPDLSAFAGRLRGCAALALILGAVAIPLAFLDIAVSRLAGGAASLVPTLVPSLVLGILAASLVAQRSLFQHVKDVATGLEAGLAEGRAAVAHLVGRDLDVLDASGVARAAIESLAENLSDGVVAPTLYLAFGGLTGGGLYKAINTADSMIGHRTPRHRAFGWAAARLDDVVNLPASRLSACLLVAAAALVPRCRARAAMRAVVRDAARHRSPNAGWPEAAMAGALGLRIAGPRSYGGAWVDDAWMGHGRSDAGPAEIRRALRLYRVACLLQIALIAALVAALGL